MKTTKTVYRYQIPIDDVGLKILHTGMPVHVDMKDKNQRHVDLWLEVGFYDETASAHFQVFGTGHPIPMEWFHVGSVVDARGLVWHLYKSPSVKA